MEKDKTIQEFFDGMKRSDEKLIIPEYPMKRRRKTLWLLPLGTAAALIILAVSLFFPRQGTEEKPEYEVILTLSTDQDWTTASLAPPESTLDTWESPTGSLISDF